MKILLIALVAIIIAIVGVSFYRMTVGPSNTGQAAVACTLEAKICPDGSSVGRVGPDCHFAECPGNTGSQASATGSGV